MSANANCFVKRLEKLIRNVKSDLGSEAFMFLDTGAIIDLEEERRRMINGQSKSALEIFNLFRDNGLPLFVISEILSEVYDHTNYYSLNGKGGNPEICSETYREVLEMHRRWCNFMAESRPNRSLDEVRYAVYLGSHAAFAEEEKKKVIDPMSAVDRELVTSGLWARHLCNNQFISGFPTGVAILTSDDHVQRTTDFLTSAHIPDRLRYRGIKTYNTRRDL